MSNKGVYERRREFDYLTLPLGVSRVEDGFKVNPPIFFEKPILALKRKGPNSKSPPKIILNTPLLPLEGSVSIF